MIEQYLESKKYAWSPSTIKTVRAKLNSTKHLLNRKPEEAFEELSKKYSTYTTKQYLIILGGYDGWKSNSDRFGRFVRDNKRLFRSAYKKRKVGLSYEEAARAISAIQDDETRRTCEFLLRSGLRISEAYCATSTVLGKGNKTRSVFVKAPRRLASQSKVRRALAVVGLRPHDLRKLCATRLVEKGVSPQDLCEIFGWSNIQTAYHYLQPSHDDKLKELMK